MIDSTVLALCVVAVPPVTTFAVAGIMRKHKRNVKTAMTNLADKLSIEFWSEQRLEPEVERILGEWNQFRNVHFRRIFKTGHISRWFQHKIDTESSVQATLDELSALEVRVKPDRPTFDFSAMTTKIDDVQRRVDDALSKMQNAGMPRPFLPVDIKPSEYVIRVGDEIARVLKGLMKTTVYIIKGDRMFVGVVVSYRYNLVGDNYRDAVPEVRINGFSGSEPKGLNAGTDILRIRPLACSNGGVWCKVHEVYWTQQDARHAIAERACQMIDDNVDEKFHNVPNENRSDR